MKNCNDEGKCELKFTYDPIKDDTKRDLKFTYQLSDNYSVEDPGGTLWSLKFTGSVYFYPRARALTTNTAIKILKAREANQVVTVSPTTDYSHIGGDKATQIKRVTCPASGLPLGWNAHDGTGFDVDENWKAYPASGVY